MSSPTPGGQFSSLFLCLFFFFFFNFQFCCCCFCGCLIFVGLDSFFGILIVFTMFAVLKSEKKKKKLWVLLKFVFWGIKSVKKFMGFLSALVDKIFF